MADWNLIVVTTLCRTLTQYSLSLLIWISKELSVRPWMGRLLIIVCIRIRCFSFSNLPKIVYFLGKVLPLAKIISYSISGWTAVRWSDLGPLSISHLCIRSSWNNIIICARPAGIWSRKESLTTKLLWLGWQKYLELERYDEIHFLSIHE